MKRALLCRCMQFTKGKTVLAALAGVLIALSCAGAATPKFQGGYLNPETAASPDPVWALGITTRSQVSMSGGGYIDHFNSSITPTATFLSSPAIYRSTDYSQTLLGILNANGSDLRGSFVYGSIAYSTTGSVPQHLTNVQGSILTPFNPAVPTTSDPTWIPDVTYASGMPPFTSLTPLSSNNTPANPYKVKVVGNFTVPGGRSVSFNYPNNGAGTLYIEVWITGSLTTSASGLISEANGLHVTYFVDGNVTTSGNGFINQSDLAQNNQISVIGSGTVTVSGSNTFIGTIEAPNSAVTISGVGSFVGGVICNTLNLAGAGSFHVDDAIFPSRSLVSAASRMVHGSSGTFDLGLSITQRTIEPRDGSGNFTVVFTFDHDVTNGTASFIGPSGGAVSGVTFSGNTMIVSLTGVTDQQTATVVFGYVSGQGDTSYLSGSVQIGFLIGDVNGDGVVNIGDSVVVRGQSGVTLDETNFQGDLNVDGAINVGDVAVVRSKSGDFLP